MLLSVVTGFNPAVNIDGEDYGKDDYQSDPFVVFDTARIGPGVTRGSGGYEKPTACPKDSNHKPETLPAA